MTQVPEGFSLEAACILMIDDDPGTIQILRRALSGYRDLRFATDGLTGLNLARSVHPDLILLDAEMPGLSGLETCALLKAGPETAGIPVIFVTSHQDTQLELEAFDRGAVDFIGKPIRPAVVRARVAAQLRIKFLTDELRWTAGRDALTGLGNRRVLDERLIKEWRRALRTGAPLSVVLVDVDFFKRYNDALGHLAGDDVLRKIAGALREVSQRSSDLAARYGGEEFVILLPDTDQAAAIAVAERFREEMQRLHIEHPRSPVSGLVTASAGVATLRVNVDESHTMLSARPDLLIAAADAALYAAKAAGRDRIEFRPCCPQDGSSKGATSG